MEKKYLVKNLVSILIISNLIKKITPFLTLHIKKLNKKKLVDKNFVSPWQFNKKIKKIRLKLKTL